MVFNTSIHVKSHSDLMDTLVFRDPRDTEITAKKVMILSVLSVSNVFMLLGNSFSIYIIISNRNLRRHTYYWLVMNLAVLDLMNSSFVVPLNIVWEYYGNWPFSQLLCDFEIFCDLGFSSIAAYSTVLLSLDKYLYITKPFFYYKRIGPKITLGSILTTWIVCMTYSTVSVFGGLARSNKAYKYDFPLDRCNFVLKHAYAIASFILLFFIPLLILVITNSKILFVARQHIKKIQDNHRVSDATITSVDVSTNSPHMGYNDSRIRPNSQTKAADTGIQTPSIRQPWVTQIKNSQQDAALNPFNKQAVPLDLVPASITTDTDGSSDLSPDTKSRGKKSVPTRNAPYNAFRAFGTVTIVVLAYIIMFAPYWLASVVNLCCACIEPMVFEDYLCVFYYMHSLVNPYIYMATDRRYKKAIHHLLARWRWCRRCKRGGVCPDIRISYVNA